jgi:hypothetical protein
MQYCIVFYPHILLIRGMRLGRYLVTSPEQRNVVSHQTYYLLSINYNHCPALCTMNSAYPMQPPSRSTSSLPPLNHLSNGMPDRDTRLLDLLLRETRRQTDLQGGLRHFVVAL